MSLRDQHSIVILANLYLDPPEILLPFRSTLIPKIYLYPLEIPLNLSFFN